MCVVRICGVEFWGIGGDFCFSISPLGTYFGHTSIHAKLPFSGVSCISSSLVYWHILY